MSLIVFCSQKGSPGASLTSLAVAAAWPVREGRRRVLVEADPAGGVLAMRYGLSREPGLLSLATSVRHGVTAGADIMDHTQALPGGLLAIVSPEHSSSIEASLAAAGPALGSALSSVDDLDVIVDIGRLSASSPTRSLLTHADVVFMVARPTPEHIVPGAEQLQAIPNGRWCLIGEKPHTPTQVVEAFGIPAQVIADDSRGAQLLEEGGAPKRVRKSALVRSARALGEHLDHILNPASLSAALPEKAEPEMLPPSEPAATPLIASGTES